MLIIDTFPTCQQVMTESRNRRMGDILLDQLVTTEAGGLWGRKFSRRDPRCTRKTMDHMVFEIVDLA